MEGLKPCPFCGGEANICSYRTYVNSSLVRKYYVSCKVCGIELPTCQSSENKSDAINNWNRRANDE